MTPVIGDRLTHRCTECGKLGYWDEDWSWYGSYRDIEDDKKIYKYCSKECRERSRYWEPGTEFDDVDPQEEVPRHRKKAKP